ncbi:MAG: hypothetical protein M1155_00255 [Patescibacteria group bacterium]|nr:hypothetical protein [Patescibacteria group bacterium]
MTNNYESEKQEAQKRFEALPEKLKKEMLADKNVQLISSVCRDYSISEDKVKDVALLVGEVFLGYTKPEEIASELHQYFDIDMQKANFIEIELKQKLFNNLKDDLAKIYNPPKIAEEPQEEVLPKIVNLEKNNAPTANDIHPEFSGAKPLSSMPTQPATPIAPKIPTMGAGVASINPQPIKSAQPTAPIAETPFIIQTKTEPVKPTIPQITKESISLNLKVEPSLINKPNVVKPVSIKIETEQKEGAKKFSMPVFINPKPVIEARQPIAPAQPNSEKVTPNPAIPPSQIFEKPISELKPSESTQTAKSEPIRTVHYSNFKTPLTPSGAPQKPEPKKEDYINLSTFTKLNGNTIDLRSNKQPTTNN